MSEGVRVRVLRAVHGDPRAAAELAAVLSEHQLAGLEPLPAEPVAVAPGLLRSQRREIRTLPPDTRRLLLIAAADQYPLATHAFLRAVTAARLDTGPLDDAEAVGVAHQTSAGVVFRDPWTRIAAYETASAWTGARPIGCSPASCAARARRPAGPGTAPPPRSGPADGSRVSCAHRRTRPVPRANTRWPALSSNGPPR